MELLVTESLGTITDEQRHALQVSQQSTGRLEALIEDLILFSLASRGELSIQHENVDLRRLVNLCPQSLRLQSRGTRREPERHYR